MNSLFKIFKHNKKTEAVCDKQLPEKTKTDVRKEKVLLVDEKTELSKLLNENNYEIITASDWKKAHAILEKEKIDILILEYRTYNDCMFLQDYIKDLPHSLQVIIFTESQDFLHDIRNNEFIDKSVKQTDLQILDDRKKLDIINRISDKITKPLDILTGKFLLTESEEIFMTAGEFNKIKHAFKDILMLSNKIKKMSSDNMSVKREIPRINKQYCSIKYIVDEISKIFEKNVSIKKEYILHTGKTYIDGSAVKLALYIILENFIIHNSESKKIILRVVNSEDDLSISIMTDSASPVQGGAFLYDEKLSVAEEIIKAHKGEIRIRNREFITIFIPLPFKEITAINRTLRSERLFDFLSFIFNFVIYFLTCSFIKKTK